MSKVLLIEDSHFFANVVQKELQVKVGADVSVARTLTEAKTLVGGDHGFDMALVDLSLPDASDSDVAEFVCDHGIPAVVFSGTLTKDMRKKLFGMGVIDSVPKQSPSSLEYAVGLVDRYLKNKSVTALVVEDAEVIREIIALQLERQGLTVLQAEDGQDALKVMEAHPDIGLVLTDYSMPNKDGFELTHAIRKSWSKDRLAVIGMSALDDQELAIKFLKSGANDFIHKPFTHEELLCRVSQNLEMLDHIARFERMATRDFLTDLHNRRYLFDVGTTLFDNAKRENMNMAVGVMDIDFFKKVNDTYGHDAGDEVLKVAATVLQDAFRGADVVARLGGEEFCVAALNMDDKAAFDVFDRARQKLEAQNIVFEGTDIGVTMSIGLCVGVRDSFDAMITEADSALYRAKEQGRNQVVRLDHASAA